MKYIDSDITGRIKSLRNKTVSAERYLSAEQAAIITRVYKNNEGIPVPFKRALSLAASLDEIGITIDPEELIVGNRTSSIRSGVVFPEAGISWLEKEITTLHAREQDPFKVRQQDIELFFKDIVPYWKGNTLEDKIYGSYGGELMEIEKVVKINQKDHAQGHICPDVETWLELGPRGLLMKTRSEIERKHDKNNEFLNSVCITLEASIRFIERYARLAEEMSEEDEKSFDRENLSTVSKVCCKIANHPPSTFREAAQSVWFLFVILQMESNASSFSPGRLDQILYPWYLSDIQNAVENEESILEIIDALFIKFNQIVYMRNGQSAKYFAGFPTGFNITIGGVKGDGTDAVNELTYLFLRAQEHIGLPQPNLTARIHKTSPYKYLFECSRVIGLGTGMPQIVNDESIIPALLNSGVETLDAIDYALVGCVELSTQGNFLGWSDAAMFNMVKVLELTMNNGVCILAGIQTGVKTGYLYDYETFEDFENAYRIQLEFFIERMISACEVVEKCHQGCLPSAFLSSVVSNCIEIGTDVTRGGAKYNYSGIQAIQVANVADCLGVLKQLVYEEQIIERKYLLEAVRKNWVDNEELRQQCLNSVPKYGNDIDWIDELGSKWIRYFAGRLKLYTNYRQGMYHMGLYTVSAHMPMGQNVGATPDGRFARAPLADGGLSPVYGRDTNGPTAVLKSVSHVPSLLAGNGALLNLKFLPSNFTDEDMVDKFVSFLRGFCQLPVHHVQFNVITTDELKKARADPESYRGLTIRVAGYTAYFTELSEDLQDEIIERTMHGESY